MKFKSVTKTILMVFILALLSVNLKAQSPRDKQIAKFLYDLPLYLRWENDFNIEVIKIGVLKGSPEFINELKRVSKGGYDGVIQIEVINFNSVADIKETHLLFLPSEQNSQCSNVLRKIAGYNTALATEEYTVKKDIMINFIKKGSEYTFEMNADNLKEANVTFIQEISRLGGNIISTKALINETEKNLKEEKRKTRDQQSLIKKQETEIQKQKDDIEKQQKELDKQKEKLLNQADEIVKQEEKLKLQKIEFLKIENSSKQTKIELDEKTKDLVKKEKDIKIQEELIREQKKLSAQLEKEIEERQKKNENLKSENMAMQLEITFKDNIILVFIGLLVVILILTFFILRNYRIKRRDNKLLAQQKSEIETINKELEKLSIVASETSNAITILDTKGKFEWINVGFTKMYGYNLQLLREELGDNLYEASNHPDIRRLIDVCLKEKKPVIYESYVTAKGGEEKWSQSTLTPILGNDNSVTKLVLIDSDISKIKEAENEILRQNLMITNQASELEKQNFELEKLSLVASKTDNSVIIANVDGEIEWVNEGFNRMLGVSFSEFSSEYGTNMFKSSLNPRLREQLQAAIKEKKSIYYSAKTTTKDGRQIWIQTTMTPIFGSNGELRKYIAIDADITKIKNAEEEISRQKQKITDSIIYACKIQEAVLPPDEYLLKLFPEYFIIFKPKDIVSGDFYWASQRGDKVMIAAADCTGHGVPGGFMSMLGMTFLNEIAGRISDNELNAGIMLTHLRESVKKSLRQTGREGEAKDGMDVALCILDKKTLELHYSGANSPLLIVRDEGQELEMINVKPDEMPIGIYYNEKISFTNHKIQLKKGDTLYIFTDGFADQFGGKNGRKFMLKRFKNMLALNSEKSMADQKKGIEKVFETWKGQHRQIDDVLIIGLRV
ncbi:MAG: YfiR/HmsC family protein [Bacteroidales bacterium]